MQFYLQNTRKSWHFFSFSITNYAGHWGCMSSCSNSQLFLQRQAMQCCQNLDIYHQCCQLCCSKCQLFLTIFYRNMQCGVTKISVLSCCSKSQLVLTIVDRDMQCGVARILIDKFLHFPQHQKMAIPHRACALKKVCVARAPVSVWYTRRQRGPEAIRG